METLHRRDPSGGFTLVELLVAMTLMLILTGSVVFVFIQAQNVFTQSMALVEVYENARYALDQIERDVANAANTADMEFYRDDPSDEAGRGHYGLDPSEAYPGIRNNRPVLTGVRYVHGLTVVQNDPWVDRRGREHRRDALYFRTVTQVEGQTRQALVAYFLHHEDTLTGDTLENPTLRRQMITMDDDGNPVIGEPVDLCEYVTDVEIELFYSDRNQPHPGTYLSAEEAIRPTGPGSTWSPRLPNWHDGGGWAVSGVIQSFEGGTSSGPGELREQADEIRLQIDGGRFDFGPLRPGDTIWVYPQNESHRQDFPSQTLEIRSIRESGTTTWATFTDDLELPSGVTTMPIDYRAGWLPSSLRIRLTIKDERSTEFRTIERIFKLLRA